MAYDLLIFFFVQYASNAAEAVCMRRSQVENALRTGIYNVLGEAKGGKHREVPLSAEAREMLTKRISNVSRGDRVFVEHPEKAHEVVNRIEKHLERHRELVTAFEGVSQRLSVTGDINPSLFMACVTTMFKVVWESFNNKVIQKMLKHVLLLKRSVITGLMY